MKNFVLFLATGLLVAGLAATQAQATTRQVVFEEMGGTW